MHGHNFNLQIQLQHCCVDCGEVNSGLSNGEAIETGKPNTFYFGPEYCCDREEIKVFKCTILIDLNLRR